MQMVSVVIDLLDADGLFNTTMDEEAQIGNLYH
jgi:hypothetical protein